MGKETKIGLGVIGVLLVTFAGVLYYRLTTDSDLLAEAPHADAKQVAAAQQAVESATEKLAATSKLIPGEVATPLSSKARNWAQAGRAANDSTESDTHQPRAHLLPTESEDTEPATRGAANPFVARAVTAAAQPRYAETPDATAPAESDDENSDAAAIAAAPLPDQTTTGDSGEDELQPLPARAADSNLESATDDAAAEKGEPAPLRALPSRAAASNPARRSRSNEPTLAVAPAAATRVSQASDQQPDVAREPFRARAGQGATASADDRYGHSRNEEMADSPAPGRRPQETLPRAVSAVCDQRLETDRAAESELDRDMPTSRPARLGGSPANRPAVARVTVENGKYKVQPNDNYWTISEKVYGSGNYFKAIHEHNRLQHPESDKLSVGEIIEVLPEAELLKRYPSLCPKPRAAAPAKSMAVQTSAEQRLGGRVYVVEQGDTLFDIARHELGKASRWAEIYDLNRDSLGEDFDFLQPGTELTLPTDKRDAEVITRQNDGGFRR